MKALLATVLILATPAISLANPPGGCPDPELAKLRHEIAAAKLDRTLDLTRDQARALLPVLKEAAQVRTQMRGDMEKRKPAIVGALTQVRDDILRTGVVSDAARKALQDARGDRTAVRGQMRGYADKVRSVLTPEQRQRLQTFDPRPLDGMGFGDEMGPGMGPGMGHGGPEGHGNFAHMGHGPRARALVMIALTPEFIQLVENRAR